MAETTQAVEEKTEEKQEQPSQDDSKTPAQSVELSEATDSSVTGFDTSINLLLDMDVSVTVSIGQTEIAIHRLLQFGPGSVLKLDKPIDAPADLYLRDTRFATGNIVVVDGMFAIRIKEVLGAGDAAAQE